MSRRTGRTSRFYFGMILALGGFTSMIFAAGAGINSTFYMNVVEVAIIFFILGVAIMLVSPSE